MSKLKIKVCGMTDVGNVEEVCSASPDYLGYIFYSKSARYVGDHPDPELFSIVPTTIKKTAVFVNEKYERVKEIMKRYGIDHIQLHGMESPEMCKLLRSSGKVVIKALPGDQLENEKLIAEYSAASDFLLFDTPVISHGGSGRKFDWSKLRELESTANFFLSGGIAHDDAVTFLSMKYRNLYAVDINSRFETEPGIKNSELVRSFINRIRNEE